jgi:hypothetical protein
LSNPDEGKSQLFPPLLDAQSAALEVQEVVHRSPTLYGLDRHSWTLEAIGQTIAWMRSLSIPAVCKLLQRLQAVYKRGRAHVHSPDLEYTQKMAAVDAAREEARAAPPGEVIFLYQDEFTAYLRPLVGRSYRRRAEGGQKATGATAAKVRLAACVDAMSGRVVWRRRSRYTVKEMYRFFYYVQKQYPQAKVIYIALDNWPVHFHPYVMEHLAAIGSRIRFLPLPTYARFPQSHGKVLAQALSGVAAVSPLCRGQNHLHSRVGWLVESAL